MTAANNIIRNSEWRRETMIMKYCRKSVNGSVADAAGFAAGVKYSDNTVRSFDNTVKCFDNTVKCSDNTVRSSDNTVGSYDNTVRSYDNTVGS